MLFYIGESQSTIKNTGGVEIVIKVLQRHIIDAIICANSCYVLSVILKSNCK